MRHMVIDTDAGSDDVVALLIALRATDVTVEAITVVAGNVPIDQGVQNALYTLELCASAHVPVYQGVSAPLLRPLQTAQYVHGQDGLGDIGLPIGGRTPTEGHAVDQLIATIERFAGDVTLVTLGPLTNVALALRRSPTLASKLSSCVIMGGTGQGYGNVTPVAEYNIWADPEAAQIVFQSGAPITMVGWDISRTFAVIAPADAASLRALGTRLSAFATDIQEAVNRFATTTSKLDGFDLPDPITMAIALDPTIATETKRLHVSIETTSELCRGQTVVDHLGVTGHEPNVDVVLAASRERFLAALHAALTD